MGKRVVEAQEKLVWWQRQILTNPIPYIVVEVREAHKEWSTLVAADESFLCQKSRVTWVREGDGNTFFS